MHDFTTFPPHPLRGRSYSSHLADEKSEVQEGHVASKWEAEVQAQLHWTSKPEIENLWK